MGYRASRDVCANHWRNSMVTQQGRRMMGFFMVIVIPAIIGLALIVLMNLEGYKDEVGM